MHSALAAEEALRRSRDAARGGHRHAEQHLPAGARVHRDGRRHDGRRR